jgi:hypothetical protein
LLTLRHVRRLSLATRVHPRATGRDGTGAGYREVSLSPRYFCVTLLLTVSYITHGRRPGLARRVPWRRLESLASTLDVALANRILPVTWRHAVVCVLALAILESQKRGGDRQLRLVSDYSMPNVSDKVVRLIHSYTDYVNRNVWKRC